MKFSQADSQVRLFKWTNVSQSDSLTFIRLLKSLGNQHVRCSCKDASQYGLLGRHNIFRPIGWRPCTNPGLILLFIPDILGADWCQDAMLERKIEREGKSKVISVQARSGPEGG